MKMRLLFSLLVACLLIPTALCQITTARGGQSDQTNIKLAKLNILIKVLPIAIRKSQFPDLLSAVEKARDIERDTLKHEDTVLATLDPTIQSLIDGAVEKGVYPSRDTQNEIQSKLAALTSQRLIAAAQMTSLVYDAVKAGFDAGQLKAMAGSFPDGFIQPGAKDGTLSEDTKLTFFVKTIFLDPLAYDILVDLSRHAS